VGGSVDCCGWVGVVCVVYVCVVCGYVCMCVCVCACVCVCVLCVGVCMCRNEATTCNLWLLTCHSGNFQAQILSRQAVTVMVSATKTM